MIAYGPLAVIARGKPSRTLVLAGGLCLAACAGARPSEPMEPPVSVALGPPAAMVMVPPPMPEIIAPPVEIMPPAEMVPPPKPPPEPPPPPPTDGPGLRAAYGAPDFIRREDESELWRYDVSGCV